MLPWTDGMRVPDNNRLISFKVPDAVGQDPISLPITATENIAGLTEERLLPCRLKSSGWKNDLRYASVTSSLHALLEL